MNPEQILQLLFELGLYTAIIASLLYVISLAIAINDRKTAHLKKTLPPYFFPQ